MRKRYQQGLVRKSKDGRYWLGQWREDGGDGRRQQRSRVLGKVSQMTKSAAKEQMAAIVKPINERVEKVASRNITVKDFVERFFFPFYRRKKEKKTAENDWPTLKEAAFKGGLMWAGGLLILFFIGWVLHKKIIFWIAKWVLILVAIIWCMVILIPLFISGASFFGNHYDSDWREKWRR